MDSVEETPQLLAMDRKNAIVADADGISLGIDGRPTDFPWHMVRDISPFGIRPRPWTDGDRLADGTSRSVTVGLGRLRVGLSEVLAGLKQPFLITW
jgi:hypothetical protein